MSCWETSFKTVHCHNKIKFYFKDFSTFPIIIRFMVCFYLVIGSSAIKYKRHVLFKFWRSLKINFFMETPHLLCVSHFNLFQNSDSMYYHQIKYFFFLRKERRGKKEEEEVSSNFSFRVVAFSSVNYVSRICPTF